MVRTGVKREMETIQRVGDIQKALASRKGTVGLVPTMGALHEGHISLVKRSKEECDVTVVSVFVNPTQFNDKNDLKNYPRTLPEDLKMLEACGVDIVFAPGVEDIYPKEDTRVFDFGILDKVMEGTHRPGHFNGVGQVVSRLFDIIRPDRAYFGEKDFQQLAIIRNLNEQLKFGIEIVGCPIVREEDGLAMSSRNVLLNKEQRAAAPLIYKTLSEAVKYKNEKNVNELSDWVIRTINQSPELEVEYFTIVDAITLQPVNSWEEPGEKQGCIAVKVGNVRLIDNMKFD